MKKMKICAFVCALAIGFTLTGCADTTWALKYDNITVPTGVYNFFLVNNASQVATQASSAAALSSGTTSTSSDIWAQTISGTTASTWAMNSALDSCKQLAVIEKLCASQKVTLTGTEKTSASSTASTYYSTNSSVYSKNGISETSLERIVNDYTYLEPALFKSYYSTNGSKAVPASTIESYYKKNYVHIKQIFVAKYNTTKRTAYTKKQLAAAKVKANAAYKAASADINGFSKYVKKYNEDPGMTKDPSGYTFSKASAAATSTSSGYDTKFVNLAFSLKVGEVGMTQSSMGYFIEYKVPLDTTSKVLTSSLKENIIGTLKGTEFVNMIKNKAKKDTFEQNNNTLNHYSPKSLDLTTSS